MIVYNKLVRDRIPEIVSAEGKTCDVRVLNDAEFAERLDEKLGEELREYEQSADVSELGDLVEIVQVIVELRGTSWEEFEQQRLMKREERGGFRKKLLLVSVVDRESG